MRLLQLPDAARQALDDGKITEGHARAILALKPDDKLQLFLLQKILNNSWSVRQAEQFVVASKKGAAPKTVVSTKLAPETNLTKTLGKSLGTKVSIKRTAKGGQLMIGFKDEDDMNRIISALIK